MVAAADPGGRARAMTRKRKTRDPAGARDARERLDALEAEIARVRGREERLALKRLHKAGYFQVRFTNGEFAENFAKAFPVEGRPPSTLSRLGERRAKLVARTARSGSGATGRDAGTAADDDPGPRAGAMTAEERETLDPAGVLDDRSVEELDVEITRVREREERLALSRLHKAGYFGVRFTNGEFAELFPQAFLDQPRRPSTLSRLERRRDARYAGRRARDARRKALLGGFVVAQCRHKPEVHAAMAPDIREWMLTHRSAEVGEKNVAALAGFLADPADKGLSAPPRDSKKARKKRTHRLILLGAWVLARRESVTELEDLVAAELARFIEQGQRVGLHKALLKDMLGN